MKKKTVKILVLIDCQNDFITGALRNEDAIKAVPRIVEKVNSFDGDAIFGTMDCHSDDYLGTREGMKLPVKHCIFGTEGYIIHPDIMEAVKSAEKRGVFSKFITKETFGTLVLQQFIKRQYPSEELDIEVVGFVSSICVITNALILKTSFYDRADISISRSCTAGLNGYNNEAALEVARSCQIEIRD